MAETATGPTLTDVTYVGRRAVKYGLIALVALVVGRSLLTAFVTYWKAANPPPPPPPTVGFGVLPQIAFPESDTQPVSYRLETASGTLPAFGDRAKVYFMPKSSLSLLADENAKKIASVLDYVFSPEVLDSRTYRWRKSQPLESTLQMDIQDYSMEITTDYLSRPELLTKSSVPTATEALNQVKEILRKTNLLAEDMATASGEVVFLKALGGELEPAVSYSDADFVQVDLNRTPIDGLYRMFSPAGYKGTVHGVVAGGLSRDSSVVHLEFNYQPVDYTQVHTYPLRTTDSAWRVLQAGEGYIASRGTLESAVIRQVYLGYFDSFDEQSYLQPIYVFEGDGGFLGYVSALDSTYIQASGSL